MRENDVTFVERLHRDLRDVSWPDPAELRATARRRSRRTGVTAAAAVLVVCASAVALVEARQPAVVAPAAPVALADVPVEALLVKGDRELRALGGVPDVELDDAGFQEPVQVDALLESCVRERGKVISSPVARYTRSRTMLAHLERDRPDSVYQVTVQNIYRMTPTAAGQVFDDTDRYASTCGTWEQTVPKMVAGEVSGTQPSLHRWQVVDRDFAGDRALMLRYTESDPTVAEVVRPDQEVKVRLIVQVGDLVTVLTPQLSHAVDPRGPTDEQLRVLARRAATRMCIAANPGC